MPLSPEMGFKLGHYQQYGGNVGMKILPHRKAEGRK